MTFYEHMQKGGLGLYVTGFVAVLGIVAFYNIILNVTGIFGLLASAIILGIFIWSTLLMSSLTVTVDNEFVRVVFGPHAFVKKFALKDIVACKPVKNDFWYSWGIHMCDSGWLYNVAGFDAVEITLVSGRQNRIGTDEPHQLAQAIQNVIAKFSRRGT